MNYLFSNFFLVNVSRKFNMHLFTAILIKVRTSFYFLMTYGVCKKRKYCNRMSEKRKISSFDECSCFVCLRRRNEQKKIPSVRPSVCLYVDFCCGHNNFRRNERIQTKFCRCLLCMKFRSGIKMQS